MNTIKVLSLLIAVAFMNGCAPSPSDTVERIPFVEDLIKQMTIEEKVGQTAQITLDVITQGNGHSSNEPLQMDTALITEALVKYHVGSVLNTANNRARDVQTWHHVVSSIQKVALEDTRLKIPVLYGIDAIHGATYTAEATMFPQQIAQAATWNRDLVYQAAQATAAETRASNIPWNFSPVLDLGVDPRWPRMWETFGEDPYLISEMGVEVIKGYQGNDLNSSTTVAACLKHFIGYSTLASSGKDRTPSEISDISLREYHLPPFRKAVESGVASVMINSGLINGIPVHSSHDIITGLLKNELGFNGLVVTDWADIENLHNRDKVASSHKEAIRLAFNAGIDMSMIPYNYVQYYDLLVELVHEEAVSMERLNDAVRRILNLKYKLGLFERPVVEPNSAVFSDAHKKLAYLAASEAITLLKNEAGLLPLSQNTKVLVAGPNANSMRTVNGGWSYSWQGEKVEEFAQDYNTILESLEIKFGKSNVVYVPGVEYDFGGRTYLDEHQVDIQAAVDAARNVDVIILCLGENTYTEKPGDLSDLMISENQEKLAIELAKTGKPIVLVLNEGRPRIIRRFADSMDAIVQTYLSGNHTGDALADILTGEVNPSGKLPYTYPMFSNSLVMYYHKHSEQSKTPEGMYDYGGGVYHQFGFGHGLSYTSFNYSNLVVSQEEFDENDELWVSVDVENTGEVAGKEVVMLFSSDLYASLAPDVKRLRRFDKIHLNAGETKKVTFSISADDFSFINAQGNRVTEAGEFTLSIAQLSETIKLLE
ncbi:glycoside hydrolase family 3 N-terminal domain-containing protein [Geofilum rubicundum]|uniref:beta-glucosidase n=1 Tax=Geofilum rubicundum JCM 15548 TaxID=1236989 RepID=A0A0E9LPR1_9BACT|nr:glycoside hydrolase family 3 N-terminal domain-containing protein [Geofilum rubicundum]GAO27572.1 beta-glucosidase [Geofilum rubicundum JCM 15548]